MDYPTCVVIIVTIKVTIIEGSCKGAGSGKTQGTCIVTACVTETRIESKSWQLSVDPYLSDSLMVTPMWHFFQRQVLMIIGSPDQRKANVSMEGKVVSMAEGGCR